VPYQTNKLRAEISADAYNDQLLRSIRVFFFHKETFHAVLKFLSPASTLRRSRRRTGNPIPNSADWVQNYEDPRPDELYAIYSTAGCASEQGLLFARFDISHTSLDPVGQGNVMVRHGVV
jgi:hypothetical protein